ncbi:hypothetical protein BDA99DRAFT_533195 [Phascolomyces articulosus]|uniref:Uncharacterized protein n=1 Tax=Phascolomyces articulosus TaxID=60185 RepID=A0AAD5K8N3_9FUNG|nr:hypothetical protein BDA99DRAFT_533195 [Phascolomyces articulosus]
MFICNGANYQSKSTMRFIMLSSVMSNKTDRLWTISESNPSFRIRIRIRMIDVQIYEKQYTSDDNWNDVFSLGRMKEIYDTCRPLLPPMDELIRDQLKELAKLKTTEEAYKFAQQIRHDSRDHPILAWVMITLLVSSLLFIQNVDVDGFMKMPILMKDICYCQLLKKYRHYYMTLGFGPWRNGLHATSPLQSLEGRLLR